MYTLIVDNTKRIPNEDGTFDFATEYTGTGDKPDGDFVGQKLTDISSGSEYAWDGEAWVAQ